MKGSGDGEEERFAGGANAHLCDDEAVAKVVRQVSVRPYILAGGRSSRMGTDKAMLLLGGRTLLGRAVDTLRAVPMLANTDGRVTVTIVGERMELEGADRVIVDGYPGCGPLGGMEAALRDLRDSYMNEYAFFLPVDMPFLPAGLIDVLLREWVAASHRGARVCYVLVDGFPQPLVCMMHKTLHPFIAEALTAGQFKVTPVLQSAADLLASLYIDSLAYKNSVLHTTLASLTSLVTVADFTATGEQQRLKRLWFSNLNNEEDFRDAETFFSAPGSS